MKKLFSLVLAVAIVLSCVGVNMIFAAGGAATVAQNGKFSTDFNSGEADMTAHFSSQSGGTVTYAADKGKDNTGALKFVGTNAWTSPNLLNASTETVFNKIGTYKVKFDVYYETLDSQTSTSGIAVMFRHSADSNNSTHTTVVYTISGSTALQANQWYTFETTFSITNALLAKEDLSFYFDRIAYTGTLYMDNFSIEYVNTPYGLVNADAESGTAHFEDFSAATGSAITSVDGGANGTDKAVKVEPNSANVYRSILYRLENNILGAYGYNGHGAGKYTLKFWLKADAEATYDLYFTSQDHLSAGTVKTTLGYTDENPGHSENTYYPIRQNIAVGTEWKEYSFDFEITQNFYDMILKLYEKGRTSAIQLGFRLQDKTTDTTNNRVAYYVDEISFEQYIAPSQEPATGTPAPKQVVNGNAENGLTGWGEFVAAPGAVSSIVQPGANNTGNAVKVDITGAYQTVAFDLGPAIVDDADYGYAGAGAGKYTVSFYAKAAEGKTGSFGVMLNPQNHKSTAQVAEIIGEAKVSTYMNAKGADIVLTDEWKKYTVEFEVSQEWLDTLKALRTTAHEKNVHQEMTYEIILRLDGAYNATSFPDRPFSGAESYFSYYVDEVEIVTPQKEDETKVPTAIKLTVNEDTTPAQGFWIKSNAGALSAADVKDGVLTKTFKIQNTGTEDIRVTFTIQAVVKNDEGNDTWAGPNGGEQVEIPAGQTATVTFECDVEDGQVEIRSQMVKLADLFYRFDIKSADNSNDILKGTEFIILCEGKDYEVINGGQINGKNAMTITTLTNYYPDGDMLPVAMIAIVAVAAVALVVVARKKKED